jgi:uncharacterized membrane protein
VSIEREVLLCNVYTELVIYFFWGGGGRTKGKQFNKTKDILQKPVLNGPYTTVAHIGHAFFFVIVIFLYKMRFKKFICDFCLSIAFLKNS